MTRETHLERYERIRAVRRAVHDRLGMQLTDEMVTGAVDEWSIWAEEGFALDRPEIQIVLVDFILYHWRVKGATLIELARKSAPEGSDEARILQGMALPIYGVMEVESVDRGLGVTAVEFRSGCELFITDVNLSRVAQPGLAFSGNLQFIDGLWSTSGGMLPLPEEAVMAMQIVPPELPRGERLAILMGNERGEKQGVKKRKSSAATEKRAAAVEMDAAAMVIVAALEGGAGERVRYV